MEFPSLLIIYPNLKFNVSIIPYTWENTSLKNIKKGDFLNTEVDMLARYVFKALKNESFFLPIKEIIEDLSNGRMVVIVDDENRENEGDLCFVVLSFHLKKLILWQSMQEGLICLALDKKIQ